jgi:hypothetical protein
MIGELSNMREGGVRLETESHISRQLSVETFFPRHYKYFSDLRARYAAEPNRKGCRCFICSVRHLAGCNQIWRVSTECTKTPHFHVAYKWVTGLSSVLTRRESGWEREAWRILATFALESVADQAICFHRIPFHVHHRYLFKQQEHATRWNKELFYRQKQIPFPTFCKSCHESKAYKKRNIKILLHTLIETDTCAHPDNYTTHMSVLPVGLHDSKGLQLQQFVNPVGVEEF